MSKYYDYEEVLSLYDYYNKLEENEKAHHCSVSTNSTYHYFIKDEQLNELRISDHGYSVSLDSKPGFGYSIYGLDNGVEVEPGLTFLEERYRNHGYIINSNKYLTTVQYSDKKVTYPTKYVNDRYAMIAIFEKSFAITNIYKSNIK